MITDKPTLIIYWARRDFRLTDNPALSAAVNASEQSNAGLLVLYCLDKNYISNPEYNVSYPRRYMLYECLCAFATQLPQFMVTTTSYEKVFEALAQEFTLKVYCNDDIEPFARLRDKTVYDILESHKGVLYREEECMTVSLQTRSQSNTIYTVFTPFKNAVWGEFITAVPLPRVDITRAHHLSADVLLRIEQMISGSLLTNTNHTLIEWLKDGDWTVAVEEGYSIDISRYFELPDLSQWHAQEEKVLLHAQEWVSNSIDEYTSARDQLDLNRTSSLSYALKWGIISTRTIINLIRRSTDISSNVGAQTFVSELIWREFYKYTLYHFPYVLDTEFMAKRRNIQWVQGHEAQRRFELWLSGTTGFDIVDAAMKQIASIGWMHNRARMITASFLTKNLGVDWRWGQSYFRATLVDLDEASNNGGWQWSASVGVDPKPVRIFNPYIQGDKFDPQGLYRQKWLGMRQAITPVVDYKESRAQALARFKAAD